jgi:hypothetical protein
MKRVLLCFAFLSCFFSAYLPSTAKADLPDNQRLRFDIGASTGKTGDTTYTEANLGISLQVVRGLVWRNSLFGRFQSETKDLYGIDSSIRGVLDLGDGETGLNLFVAPGYRFTSDSDREPAPFGEAGLTLRAGGISIGGGIKTIFNKWVNSGLENDTQYFVTLGGGVGI